MLAEKLIPVENLCSHCETRPREEDHTCPFAEDVNGDFDSLCDCCDDCTHECAMDI